MFNLTNNELESRNCGMQFGWESYQMMYDVIMSRLIVIKYDKLYNAFDHYSFVMILASILNVYSFTNVEWKWNKLTIKWLLNVKFICSEMKISEKNLIQGYLNKNKVLTEKWHKIVFGFD